MKSKQLQRYEYYLKKKKGVPLRVVDPVSFLIEYPEFRHKNRPKLIGHMEK